MIKNWKGEDGSGGAKKYTTPPERFERSSEIDKRFV